MNEPAILLGIFDPPRDLVGQSAVLVAMTATEDFLEDALMRFTRLRSRQRAEHQDPRVGSGDPRESAGLQ